MEYIRELLKKSPLGVIEGTLRTDQDSGPHTIGYILDQVRESGEDCDEFFEVVLLYKEGVIACLKIPLNQDIANSDNEKFHFEAKKETTQVAIEFKNDENCILIEIILSFKEFYEDFSLFCGFGTYIMISYEWDTEETFEKNKDKILTI